MIDMSTYWPVVLILGLGTFLLRFSFILIMDRLTVPEAFTRMLRFIPASVLPALVAPAIVLHGSGPFGFSGLERPLAALVGAMVAWWTRNILLTICAGMGTLWLLKAVL